LVVTNFFPIFVYTEKSSEQKNKISSKWIKIDF